jgi:hypothetical protein
MQLSDDPTKQELFDFALQGLWDQNAISRAKTTLPTSKVILSTACLYRGINETACAIGLMMTDEEATWADDLRHDKTWFSGTGIGVIANRSDCPLRPFFKKNANFLQYIQRIHDNIEPEDNFRQKLLKEFRAYHTYTFKNDNLDDSLLAKLEKELADVE